MYRKMQILPRLTYINVIIVTIYYDHSAPFRVARSYGQRTEEAVLAAAVPGTRDRGVKTAIW